MSAEKIIRKQGRELLQHNYVAALVGLLMISFVFVIYDTLTSVSSLLIMMTCEGMSDEVTDIIIYSVGLPVGIGAVYLCSPVFIGYERMYRRASVSCERFDPADLFYCFHKGRYGRALRLNLSLTVRMLVPALVASLPPVIYYILSVNVFEHFYDTPTYRLYMFILVICSVFLTVMWGFRYFAVYALYNDYDYMSVREIFAYNREVANSAGNKPVQLLLSFIPWLLLCIAVLPMLYVIPYLSASFATSCKWLTKAQFERNMRV